MLSPRAAARTIWGDVLFGVAIGTMAGGVTGPSYPFFAFAVVVNGLWGVLSVGIFATGRYGAGWNGVVRDSFVKAYGSEGVHGPRYPSQLVMQAIDCAVLAVFAFSMAYVWFKISDLITPIRVSEETEIEGLDGPEMGVLGYPDFMIHTARKMVE